MEHSIALHEIYFFLTEKDALIIQYRICANCPFNDTDNVICDRHNARDTLFRIIPVSHSRENARIDIAQLSITISNGALSFLIPNAVAVVAKK